MKAVDLHLSYATALRLLFLLPAAAAYFLAGDTHGFAVGALLAVALLCQIDRLPRSLIRFKHGARVAAKLAIAAAIVAFFQPQWPSGLDAWETSAALAACAVAAAALSLLPDGLGLGRLFLQVSFLSGLAVAGGFAASGADPFSWSTVGGAVLFACVLELLRSGRYALPQNPLATEFVAAVSAAALTAGSTRSLPLTILLVALPLFGFALRNHLRAADGTAFPFAERLEIAHTQRPRHSLLPLALAATIAICFAGATYLTLLKTPFWANHARNAPHGIASLAHHAEQIASKSTLQPSTVRDRVEAFDAASAFRGLGNRIESAIAHARDAWPKSDHASADPNPYSPETASGAAPPPDFEKREESLRPVGKSLFTLLPEAPTWKVRQQANTPNSWPSLRRDVNISAPPPSLKMELPLSRDNDAGDAEVESITFDTTAEMSDRAVRNDNPPTVSKVETPRPATDAAATTSYAGGNTHFPVAAAPGAPPVSDIATPPVSASYGSFLRMADGTEAPVGQDAVLVARIEPRHETPDRLYLRTSHMDTVSPDGISAPFDLGPAALSPLNEGRFEAEPFFQPSRHDGASATIAVKANRLRQLPVAESFTALDIPQADTLAYHGPERIIANPIQNAQFTYRILGADFSPSRRHLRNAELAAAEKKRLLDLPLPRGEIRQLRRYAREIAGRRPSRSAFAERASEYFRWKHVYSLEATVPDGPGHPTLRWLEAGSSGICVHYATAYVMLARSLGIPARVVAGYASDEYDAERGVFVVREAHAHAWAEYLDESNRWIRIDPTPPISPQARSEQLARSEPLRPIDDLVAQIAAAAAPEQIPAASPNVSSAEPGTVEAPPSFSSDAQLEQFDDLTLDPATIAQHTLPTDDRQTLAVEATGIAQPEALEASDGEASNRDLSSAILVQPSAAAGLESVVAAVSAEIAQTREDSEAALPSPDASRDESSTRGPSLSLILLLSLPLLGFLALALSRSAKHGAPLLAFHAKAQNRRIRSQAGRLLQRVENAIAERRLENHDLWRELRLALQTLRYGPRADNLQLKSLKRRADLLDRAHFNRWS